MRDMRGSIDGGENVYTRPRLPALYLMIKGRQTMASNVVFCQIAPSHIFYPLEEIQLIHCHQVLPSPISTCCVHFPEPSAPIPS